MPNLRIIGDIHAERDVYKTLLKDAPYTIQIGDLDFDYSWMITDGIDPGKHKFLAGNHDNYDTAPKSPHYLGDFGMHTVPGFGDIFFVRGGWSIDHKARRAWPVKRGNKLLPKNYWPENEELTVAQAQQAFDLYKQLLPNFVIAHECPLGIVPFVTNPSFVEQYGHSSGVIKTLTNQLLEGMVSFHKPKVFCFGHYHHTFDRVIEGTRYVCVNMCQAVDFMPLDQEKAIESL